ncbi:ucp10 [Candida pseudojiufengensis]|uniref:ucp10 n=1 Tax=Candida pseudojiufengensis TaxID=497109 RepID=UPI0022258ABA|nr:ucp10 [Candida pseudojiufengensis]KAI5965588.1 ucp10 [Candida pseudojiufengensis]
MSLPRWVESFINPGYRRLGTNDSNNSNNNNNQDQQLPGAFPNDESIEEENLRRRNSFNSQSLNEYASILLKWINYLLIQPIIISIIIIFRILSKVLNTIYFKNLNVLPSPNENIDPIDKVNKFVRNLEDNIQPKITNLTDSPTTTNNIITNHHPQLPPFYEGSYTQALYMATHRAKFLFVYLTNPQNENSSFIFNEIILSSEFNKIFYSSTNQNNIIIWGGDLTNPEAYQLANSLNVTKFPFLGLLCLTRLTKMTPDGPKKDPAKISLIAKLQGGNIKTNNGGLNNEEDSKIIIKNKFLKKIEKYEPELSLIRKEYQDHYMTEILKKQQEYNYLLSLQKDIQKKNAKEKAKKQDEFFKSKASVFQQFQLQPTTTNVKNYAKIVLKFSDSTRKTIYLPKSLKVINIYIYVELLKRKLINESPKGKIQNIEEINDIDNDLKDIEFKFKISSPLPPRLDLKTKINELIENVDIIYPNGLLLVEDI